VFLESSGQEVKHSLLMNDAVTRVLILGGGSAGWLTAGVIAAGHCGRIDVTLVESPNVPTIGVGEGTWPSMRETLRSMGVSETEFIRECDVSFKQGSRFLGWCDGDTSNAYYHPFSLPQKFFELDCVRYWQSQSAGDSFTEAVSPQGMVCDQHLAPKQESTPEYAAVLNYGYHLDATKFGQFLSRHCREKLGVHHVVDHVTGLISSPDGTINALETQSNGQLQADLFVDCSGVASLLIGKHFRTPFVSRKHVLFNDRALAVQVPYSRGDQPIASVTLSTAQKSGWIWDIGLPTRRGVGYVYSSSHSSDDQAEDELRSYLVPALGEQGAEDAELRQLRFDPGHYEVFWLKNCVAVGMAAGFIEPLEASALALVELSAAMIRDDLPTSHSDMAISARRFNDRFQYRWDRIMDFLKLHYVLSRRRDTDYWRDHCDSATMPDHLRQMLRWWRHKAPSRRDFFHADEIFTAASYQYILYGMGFTTDCTSHPGESISADSARRYVEDNAAQARRLVRGLPSNRELLASLREHRLVG